MQLTDAYVEATKRPWTQPIGYEHALFEVAIDVLKRTKAIDPKSILDAIVATDYQSIVGGALDRPAGEECQQDTAGCRPMAAQGQRVRIW